MLLLQDGTTKQATRQIRELEMASCRVASRLATPPFQRSINSEHAKKLHHFFSCDVHSTAECDHDRNRFCLRVSGHVFYQQGLEEQIWWDAISLYTMYVLFNCYMAQGDLRVVLDGEMYWIFLVHLHQLLAWILFLSSSLKMVKDCFNIEDFDN